MFESIKNIFKKTKKRELLKPSSKEAAKERLHLVLMQDRANVSADFLDLMVKEIVEVIKKYIDIDEDAIDVRLTNETDEDGVQGVPALYANIPIINIKDETRKLSKTNQETKLNIDPPKHEAKKEEENSKEEKKTDIENQEPKKDKEIKENEDIKSKNDKNTESKEENIKGKSNKSKQSKKITKNQEEKEEIKRVQENEENEDDKETEQTSTQEQKNIEEEKKNEE